MAFNGYLMKAVKTNAIFPHKYIAIESYRTKPNIREEIDSYRDDNTRNLTRITAEGEKTTITFAVMDNLHLADMSAILKWFTDAEVDHKERKIQIEYWNDEDLTYKTGYFYRTDIDFIKKTITPTDIIYKSFEIKLVEY